MSDSSTDLRSPSGARTLGMRELADEPADVALLRRWLTANGQSPTAEEVRWQYFGTPTKRTFVDVVTAAGGTAPVVVGAHAAASLWVRFRGERQLALATLDPRTPLRQTAREGHADDLSAEAADRAYRRASDQGAALAYGLVDAGDPLAARQTCAARGWTSLGPAPLLVRPLRLSRVARTWGVSERLRALLPEVGLIAPFGSTPCRGFRDVTSLPVDPRITRLWDRFSIDVGVAIERSASYFGWRIVARPGRRYRTFIVEDGDRYAIRAMCIFRVGDEDESGAKVGYVMELLHDRSLAGMRAAFHILGLALREMSDAGAGSAAAWSLRASGSYPLYALHGFASPATRPTGRRLELGVRALDPAVEPIATSRARWYLSLVDDLSR